MNGTATSVIGTKQCKVAVSHVMQYNKYSVQCVRKKWTPKLIAIIQQKNL